MKPLLPILKALADETRLSALAALAGGELCLCQLIGLLGLAPSTVSKHMGLLVAAGLVVRRKEGKWHYFRLAGEGAPTVVRAALAWVLAAESCCAGDPARVDEIKATDLSELCSCYTRGASAPVTERTDR